VLRHWPILLVAGSFLGFGLFALDDFGLTWDELHTYRGAEANRRFLTGQASFEQTIQSIERMPGFYFVSNSLRGFAARLIGELFGWGPVRSHHLLGLIASTLCVILTYRIAVQVSGAVRLSALAAAALAVLPPFLAHSQSNPKDLPAVLCYLASASLLISVAAHGRRRHVVGAALALGVSVTTRVICVFVVPLMLAWLALCWRTRLRRHAGPLAVTLVGAVPVAFACWPWLWDAPFEKLADVSGILTVWGEGRGLYLGQLVDLREMPWHYLSVHLLAAIPLSLLALGALAPVATAVWRRDARPSADLVWLGIVWVGFLLAAEQLSARRYDGLRHFLAILPGVAILVGAGLELLVRTVERALAGADRRPLRRLATCCVVGVFAAGAATPIASMHPYHGAFLNLPANAAGGPHTEEWLEVEYWGGAYREGVAWLAQHAEPDSEVCVPIAGRVAAAQSGGLHILGGCEVNWFRDTSRPAYLMFITRMAWYQDTPIPEIERDYDPIFEIRRQQATLLRVYKNR
jgi:hypothetical protein